MEEHEYRWEVIRYESGDAETGHLYNPADEEAEMPGWERAGEWYPFATTGKCVYWRAPYLPMKNAREIARECLATRNAAWDAEREAKRRLDEAKEMSLPNIEECKTAFAEAQKSRWDTYRPSSIADAAVAMLECMEEETCT